MTTIKTSHRSIASLKLPKQPVAIAAYATGVVKAMTGKPTTRDRCDLLLR
jgi:hypothetical protein